MRILFIIHQPTLEGAGRFLLDEVDFLRNRGVTAGIVLPSEGPLRDALIHRGAATLIVSFPWWCRTPTRNATFDRDHLLNAARKIAAWAREWRADLLYTQTLASPVGAVAAVLAGLPHVWHIHEFSHEAENLEVPISRRELDRFADQTSNLVVFNSKAVANEWADFPSNKALLVYNWIAPHAPPSAPPTSAAPPALVQALAERFVIIHLGSINPHKHQSDGIEALARLVASGCDAALLIVGPILNAAYHGRLLTLIGQHNLSERVHFVGYTSAPTSWLQLADVSIVCSPKEPFGRVTIESMDQGIPVIGADGAGTAEIIQNGVSGLLFPPSDIDALARQLRQLADNVELRHRLILGGRQRARDFSSVETQMEPLLARLQNIQGEDNPMSAFGDLLAPALATLAANDARTMPFTDLLRLAAGRVRRRLGLNR